jgi:hypothetical protein
MAMRRTPVAFKPGQRFARLGAGLVLQSDPADAMPAAGDKDQAEAFGFIEINRLEEIIRDALVFEPLSAANKNFGAVNHSADAATGRFGEIFGSAKGTPASPANWARALAAGWLLYFSAEAAMRSNSAGAFRPEAQGG